MQTLINERIMGENKNAVNYPRFEIVNNPSYFIIHKSKQASLNSRRFIIRAMCDQEDFQNKNNEFTRRKHKMGIRSTPEIKCRSSKKIKVNQDEREVIIGFYPDRMKEELQAIDSIQNMPASLGRIPPPNSRMSQPIIASSGSIDNDVCLKPMTAPAREENPYYPDSIMGQRGRFKLPIPKHILQFPETPIHQQRKALGGSPRLDTLTFHQTHHNSLKMAAQKLPKITENDGTFEDIYKKQNSKRQFTSMAKVNISIKKEG